MKELRRDREQEERKQHRDDARRDPIARHGKPWEDDWRLGWIEGGRSDGNGIGVQRVLHLIDHETEAGEIEVVRPSYPGSRRFVRDDRIHGDVVNALSDYRSRRKDRIGDRGRRHKTFVKTR